MDCFKFLNYNEIIITDGFILADKTQQKMDVNLVKILEKLLLLKKPSIGFNITILTKYLNPISQSEIHKKEKAKKRCKVLTQKFPRLKSNFHIIMYDIDNKYVFHDRIIQTNFSLLECGKGFNLYNNELSNSQIISETIFDKYTYDRLKRHNKMQKDYIASHKPDNRFFSYP